MRVTAFKLVATVRARWSSGPVHTGEGHSEHAWIYKGMAVTYLLDSCWFLYTQEIKCLSFKKELLILSEHAFNPNRSRQR